MRFVTESTGLNEYRVKLMRKCSAGRWTYKWFQPEKNIIVGATDIVNTLEVPMVTSADARSYKFNDDNMMCSTKLVSKLEALLKAVTASSSSPMQKGG